MKLTKQETLAARTELVKTILKINALGKSRDALKEKLAGDFESHKKEYFDGIQTEAGILIRKPHGYDIIAKELVEA